jgi:hypothetical protein
VKLNDKVICITDYYNGVKKGEICIVGDYWIDSDNIHNCFIRPLTSEYGYYYQSDSYKFKFESKNFDRDFITLKQLRKNKLNKLNYEKSSEEV